MFLLYVRYIDDVLAMCENIAFAMEFERVFNKQSKSIQLKFEYACVENNHTVPYLDLLISKGELFAKTGLFDVSVYQKPMNAYLYIPVFSFHSRNTYRSFIESEVRRYTLCCTNPNDVSSMLVKFRQRLKDRGYPDKLLDVCLSRVFVRNEILFPLIARIAYGLNANSHLILRNCDVCPFNPPYIAKKKRDGLLVFVLENSPRYSDSVLRDILSYEKSGARFTYELCFDVLTQKRKSSMVCKKSAPKIGRDLFRSRYVKPK